MSAADIMTGNSDEEFKIFDPEELAQIIKMALQVKPHSKEELLKVIDEASQIRCSAWLLESMLQGKLSACYSRKRNEVVWGIPGKIVPE